ncbi:MAG: hypothetical protein ABJD24_14800 [Acidimicrobiales bacterium]
MRLLIVAAMTVALLAGCGAAGADTPKGVPFIDGYACLGGTGPYDGTRPALCDGTLVSVETSPETSG